MQAIGRTVWHRTNSVTQAYACTVSCAVIMEDGSIRSASWVDRGDEDNTPAELRDVPIVATGGDGHGLDLERFRRGQIQTVVANDPVRMAAARRCHDVWARMRHQAEFSAIQERGS